MVLYLMVLITLDRQYRLPRVGLKLHRSLLRLQLDHIKVLTSIIIVKMELIIEQVPLLVFGKAQMVVVL